MDRYNFKEIENKWQIYWEKNNFSNDTSLFDQSEKEILAKFIVAVGYDMLHENGLPEFQKYFNEYPNKKISKACYI
mgnify:CR=1 FL=1